MPSIETWKIAWKHYPLRPLILEPAGALRTTFSVTGYDIVALQTFGPQLAAEGFSVPAAAKVDWHDTRSLARHFDRFHTEAPDRYAAAIQGLIYMLGPQCASTVFARTAFDPARVPLMPIATPFPWSGTSIDDALAGDHARARHDDFWRASSGRHTPRCHLTLTGSELEALGAELLRLRVARGLTLANIAVALGLSRLSMASVMKLEKGRHHNLTTVQLVRLAQLFGLEDRYFLDFLARLRREPSAVPFLSEVVRFRAARRLLVRAAMCRACGDSWQETFDVLWPIAKDWKADALAFRVPVEDIPGGSFQISYESLLRDTAGRNTA